MKYIKMVVLVFLIGILGCIQPPEYPIEPVIEFVSFSKDVIHQQGDTTTITISFTDGDGDLGSKDDDPTVNLYLTDPRIPNTETFKIPFIPQQGVGNGISGEISVKLFPPVCCFHTNTPCLPTPNNPEDQVAYEIQIEDRAGNRSNKLSLPALTLICD